MSSADPWQTAEVGGPKKATVITKPAMAKAVIGRARSPVLLLGNQSASAEIGDRKLVDYLLVLARAYRIPVIATGNVNRALVERGYMNALILPAVVAGQRIADPVWEGPGGKGPCDLAIIAGLPYPMAWTLLSGLKHFAPHTRTITLDNKYQPNATWSFANLSEKDWQENLEAIIEETTGGAAGV
ncbi:CO dehydrogenase/acetyl-CoA synthase complex, epsilon subunit [Methanoregula boonei 6A8]|jgi:acetyl-CoA decarbonylase/synthase complex subunit epsilon|uniref:CO dehydrogenase/acetyl-CoA synthase complex, epsilon subunit n=1 Tax=Methanoregula boonei (strain DSM 21154 / JCM 14090 / 6A8) TaxID=456442 RepID=A7I829_METB6|nr:CO dehydrogenase/acetyl-CoA synthase complex subunit epsilon [Methanoregula boonei]ABS55890.1 CO dehydrogenase/acetyl-CoA synthase complex, epsilon subunit [Methanoregula boonei 6A8]